MRIDKIYFTSGNFENIKNGKKFDAHFDKNDRFFRYFLPYLLAGQAEGMKPLKMDYLCIPVAMYHDLNKSTFRLTANTIFQETKGKNEDDCYAGVVRIDRVCIENVDPRKVVMNGENVIIEMCDMVLQYQSEINYTLLED